MTSDVIMAWVAELRPRYRASNEKEKAIILDEFCKTTGYHRKSAIRLMNRQPKQGPGKRRGRPPIYRGGEFMSALLLVWEGSGFVCGQYLHPAMPQLVERMEACGELMLTTELRERLLAVSGAVIDRLLKSHRAARREAGQIGNRLVSDLRNKIAAHTFADLRNLELGHMEIDLVLHCGMSTRDFYLTTLVAVDTATSWTECIPVWGKGKERVAGSVARLKRQIPFTLAGLHNDNGSEFINDILYAFCQKEKLAFSHGRVHHSNDQPRVEQRNGSIVRRLIGYGRYSTRKAYDQLDLIYSLVRLQANFLRPTAKLVYRERQGGKEIKRYDTPSTPYQRLLATHELTDDERARLVAQYQTISPLKLQREIGAAIETLWQIETPDPASERAQRLRRRVEEAQSK